MKTKLYLKVEGALDVKVFTDKKQAKPVDRVVLLDKEIVDKFLVIQTKWKAQQLILDEVLRGAYFIDDKEIKEVSNG